MPVQSFSSTDEAFRGEVRAFLDAELTPELRRIGRETTGVFTDWPLAKPWHQILYRKGWIAPFWPQEYGGTGWSIVQQYIFSSEATAAHAPRPAAMGLRMVAPILMRFGREDQKKRYIPKILSGDDLWCQGYSEPGSGSDLASLQTRAISDGDDYIVNGSKIWTTHAQWATRMFCLVRTDPTAKPQAGITFLLLDMDTPGITIKPIITLAGDHEVNQVFFDDVRVPKSNRVGEENQGWTVAKHLLEFERGGSASAGKHVEINQVRALADAIAGTGAAALGDAWYERLAQSEIALSALEGIERKVLSAVSRGDAPGPASSLLKLMGSELSQKISELGLEALGYLGLPDQHRATAGGNSPIGPEEARTTTARYLNQRAVTIFGGTSEVQRNLIAKLVIGL